MTGISPSRALLSLTLIVLHKYTHVKPAALPYLRVTAAAVLNKSEESIGLELTAHVYYGSTAFIYWCT